MTRIRSFAVLAVLLAACTAPTAPVPGELAIERVEYHLSPAAGVKPDTALVYVKARWIPGQFTLVVRGAQWAPVSIDVAGDGEGVVPVVLVRLGAPTLTFPDTITASAVNFTPTSRVTR